jgi:hypothetical protein
MIPTHPRIVAWMQLSDALVTAAETGVRRALVAARPKRKGSYAVRRPGYESPMWNVLAALLRGELAARGTKVRLARYLGVPRQRLHDFLTGHSRLPDAELTLRMLHWIAEKRAGRDPSI